MALLANLYMALLAKRTSESDNNTWRDEWIANLDQPQGAHG